jgi:hypothetical protein
MGAVAKLTGHICEWSSVADMQISEFGPSFVGSSEEPLPQGSSR